MAKIILSFDGDVVKEYELDKEVLTIGRKAENDIHIDNLAVSSKHARVLTILNDSFIEDLGSTNGTFVGDNKVTKHALQNGESITIGKHQLKYVSDETDFEQTTIILPGTEGMPGTEEAGTTTGGPGPAKLQLVSGPNAGKELKLTKILTTLGRPDLQVAAITRRPTGYFLIVVDAGKDGKMPLVNDAEMDKQHLLTDDDVIEVAGVKMQFNLT